MEVIVKWDDGYDKTDYVYDKIDLGRLTITANSQSHLRDFSEATMPLSEVGAHPWSAILLGEVLDTSLTLKEFLKANYPEALL
jgi:hypothetical protein